MSKVIYVRPQVERAPKPVYEHREVYKRVYGKIQGGWEVHHVDHNHSNNVPENLVALPISIHKFIHTRRVSPSRAACEAAVAWWQATHPCTRRRLLRVKLPGIFKDYRRRESAVGREQRVAEYLAQVGQSSS